MNLNVMIAMAASGIAFIVIDILYINAVLACKIETTGTYLKYNTVHKGRGSAYEPVFRYYIKGEEFQGRCLNELSLAYIQKQFVAGRSYTIYVNDKKPGFFVVYRKVRMINVIGVLVGIALLAGVMIGLKA